VVRASADELAVENLIGDVVLTCLVPDRLAEKAAALEPGDKIRMVCVRHKGRKAQLVKIQQLGEHKTERKKTEEKQSEKQEAAGEVAELAAPRSRRAQRYGCTERSPSSLARR